MIKIRYFDLLECFNNEIYKHAKNKRSVDRFDKIKMCGCYSLYKELINNTYEVGKYNIFIIREPKHRLIMSLPIKDKLINHVIARKVLEPKLNKYLDSRNVASRKNMGSSEGIRLVKKYIERLKKYDNFYVLKIDIKKYFYSIDHEVLKSMLIKILNGEEYSLVCKIIDSTNADYINNKICEIKAKYIERYPHFKNEVNELPLCEKGKSLSIGNMTSQILSIFYLSSIDHFIVHDLHIPNYVRYADDFVLMHESKTELENVLKVIIQKLKLEYKLDINLKKHLLYLLKQDLTF